MKLNLRSKYSSKEKWQISIFVLCWGAYASAYFSRVNLSVALPALEQSFGWSKTELGLIGSCFFWVYGIGQLINGYIGDKISSRSFIFIGLIVSALTNFAFGFATSLFMMILLWSVNGYFQSMLWGPIVKTLSSWFPKSDNTRVSVGISTSMVGGFLLGWGVSGQVMTWTHWKWAFWIPGCFVLIYAVIWLWKVRSTPEEAGFIVPNNTIEIPSETITVKEKVSTFQFMHRNKLFIIAFACMAQGIIKDGITLWGPTYLMETQSLNITSTTSYILLIPIMNFGGIFLAGWLNKRFHYNEKPAIIFLLSCTVLSVLGLFYFASISIMLCVILLAFSSAFMYGANTLLLSVIPMGFSHYNKASSVAGFLDFSSYMGAGITGVMTGFIVDSWGWNGILILWVSTAAIGITAMISAGKMSNKKEEKNND